MKAYVMNDNKWVSRIRILAKHVVVLRHLLCLGTVQTTGKVLGQYATVMKEAYLFLTSAARGRFNFARRK
jgi:hypothetical protein